LEYAGEPFSPRPDHERVTVELIHVEGLAFAAVEPRLDLLARLGAEAPFATDDLQPPDSVSAAVEVDTLGEEEAALEPLEGDLPGDAAGDRPRARLGGRAV
jgi:hypothetical protein